MFPSSPLGLGAQSHLREGFFKRDGKKKRLYANIQISKNKNKGNRSDSLSFFIHLYQTIACTIKRIVNIPTATYQLKKIAVAMASG